MTRRPAPQTALTDCADPVALVAVRANGQRVPICRPHWRAWWHQRENWGAQLTCERAGSECVVCADRRGRAA